MTASTRIQIQPAALFSDKAIPAGWIILGFLLAAVAYAPALNNGFISDDFIILERVDSWLKDFRGISIPPEGIRATSYFGFAILRVLAGFRPELFYVFAIGLHCLNIWLFGRLLMVLTGRKSLAVSGIILFATVQNPQEAIMWLAGVSDAFVGTFTLAALLAWCGGRIRLSLIFYAGALLSKESGIVFLVLAPLSDWMRLGELRFRRQYLYLLLPAAGYLALFIANLRGNTYLSAGLYKIRLEGLLIIANSAHRLAFPWLYLALLMLWPARWWKDRRSVAAFLIWIATAIAPYAFITYQNHIPSRSQYLASMGLAGLIALLLESCHNPKLRAGFLTAFAVVNIGYLWFAKDRQYVERAAPTTRLLEQLRSLPPQCLRIADFPLNPWIGKETALQVQGWSPEMLHVNEPAIGPCLELRWDSRYNRYERAAPRP